VNTLEQTAGSFNKLKSAQRSKVTSFGLTSQKSGVFPIWIVLDLKYCGAATPLSHLMPSVSMQPNSGTQTKLEKTKLKNKTKIKN
jgi:hypothetical protein